MDEWLEKLFDEFLGKSLKKWGILKEFWIPEDDSNRNVGGNYREING